MTQDERSRLTLAVQQAIREGEPDEILIAIREQVYEAVAEGVFTAAFEWSALYADIDTELNARMDGRRATREDKEDCLD